MSVLTTVACALLFAAPAPAPALGLDQTLTGLSRRVAFDQHLDAQVPLDLILRDEQGRPVRLGDLLVGRPAILALVYYECPMLCNEVLNSLLRSLNALAFDAGKEFNVITVSIDPGESPELAGRKKAMYLKRYGRKGADQGWRFLTGSEASVRRLADVIGFRYVYDPKTDQYAHPAGITILTPGGRIARYFYGVSFPARDLQFGLMEAASGKIGSPVQKVLLMCFHYDPRTGKYNLAIMSAIRFLGIATVATLGTFIVVMLWRDRRMASPRLSEPGGRGSLANPGP
jgi:protein SCO1/2